MLVIVDAQTGSLITAGGRECVSDDPEGKEFPWLPKPLSEKFKGTFLKGESETVNEDVLKNKVKGLYFSAHWVNCMKFNYYFVFCISVVFMYALSILLLYLVLT